MHWKINLLSNVIFAIYCAAICIVMCRVHKNACCKSFSITLEWITSLISFKVDKKYDDNMSLLQIWPEETVQNIKTKDSRSREIDAKQRYWYDFLFSILISRKNPFYFEFIYEEPWRFFFEWKSLDNRK